MYMSIYSAWSSMFIAYQTEVKVKKRERKEERGQAGKKEGKKERIKRKLMSITAYRTKINEQQTISYTITDYNT